MRKNGVNKTLTPIQGGVCAPDGFSAGAVYCGIAPKNTPFYNETREDLGVIISSKLVPTACVYASDGFCGAPIMVTKKHLRSGKARAILVNSGIANVGVEKGEKEAEKVSGMLWHKLHIEASETVIASTGAITGTFPSDKIIEKADALIEGLGAGEEYSLSVARAMMTADKKPKQFAFSFEIGDYTCKIGAVFKGSKRVCPNMATTLCFLTTDVAIDTPHLQKALSFAVSETLNCLDLDGISSPNDTVCIMANGKAGNYKISCNDSEYKKFTYFLTETLRAVAQELAKEYAGAKNVFACEIKGAKSKSFARLAANGVVRASGVKKALQSGEISGETVLCATLGVGEYFKEEKVEIFVQSSEGKLVLMEDGKRVLSSIEHAKKISQGENLIVFVHFHGGNYGIKAIGCLD